MGTVLAVADKMALSDLSGCIHSYLDDASIVACADSNDVANLDDFIGMTNIRTIYPFPPLEWPNGYQVAAGFELTHHLTFTGLL